MGRSVRSEYPDIEPKSRERIVVSVAKKVAIGLIIVVGFGIIVANQVPKIERSL